MFHVKQTVTNQTAPSHNSNAQLHLTLEARVQFCQGFKENWTEERSSMQISITL